VLRALSLLILAAIPATADPIGAAFNRLYNFDFAGAHKILDAHIAQQPNEELAHAARAAAYLFYELDRLGILAAEFFLDDKKLAGKKKLAPDAQIRERFFDSVAEAQRLAALQRATDPADRIALFTMCLTEGMRTDYMAFIEKKQLRSLVTARSAHRYAVELLRHHPGYADAYLSTGLSEYLMGSLPFFVRWFARFDQVKGSKDQAVINLEKAARDGQYLGPFARILLVVLHLREKRPQLAIPLLEQLSADYPENPLLRHELSRFRQSAP
jgi:hypothetical protein